MNTMNPKVDFYFDKASKWQEKMQEIQANQQNTKKRVEDLKKKTGK